MASAKATVRVSSSYDCDSNPGTWGVVMRPGSILEQGYTFFTVLSPNKERNFGVIRETSELVQTIFSTTKFYFNEFRKSAELYFWWFRSCLFSQSLDYFYSSFTSLLI